jgi:hypothetical protein
MLYEDVEVVEVKLHSFKMQAVNGSELPLSHSDNRKFLCHVGNLR